MAKRAKQGHLPTMEPEVIPEIEAAAEAYVEARDARMRLGGTEVERRTMLMGLMKKFKLKNYDFDGKTVSLVSGEEKVRVKTKKDAEEEGDED